MKIVKTRSVSTTITDVSGLSSLFKKHPSLMAKRVFPDGIDSHMAFQLGEALDSRSMNAVFWKGDLWEISQAGRESFIGKQIPLHLFPDISYWSIERDLNVKIAKGVLPADIDDGKWGLIGYILFKGQGYTEQTALYQIGVLWRLAEDVTETYHELPIFLLAGGEGEIIKQNCGIVAAVEFMNLPFVSKEAVTAPRHERRRAEREGRTIPSVSVINLRRKESSYTQNEYSTEREYHCQWIRRGHWRKLHKPRKADNAEVTYIRDALCGPEDKPLKSPTMRVAKVTR